MRKSWLKYYLLLVSLLIFCAAFAQVKTKTFNDKVPENLLPSKNMVPSTVNIAAPVGFDSLMLKSQSQNDAPDAKNKFAEAKEVSIDVLKNAKLIETKDSVFYFLTIKAEKAKSISLHFGKFILSPNAVMTLYNQQELTDSITAKENNRYNFWATRIYHENELNIVIRMPLKDKGKSEVLITQVNFGLQSGAPGASLPCNVNVACPTGGGWTNERSAVAFISDGSEYFTGTLIMNTCGLNIPYILTARHVLNNQDKVYRWVFQFQFYSATCDVNSGWREDLQFTGGTLKAHSDATDFALVQLNQTPSPGSGLAYAGWTRQTSEILNTTILHHPVGDLMKISVDNEAPVLDTYLYSDPFPHPLSWKLDLNLGATQGGSSGSPYFNQDHRIFAQHAGENPNQNPNGCLRTDKWGGRFYLSWTGGGTNSTQLSNWLDPNNTGATSTNTTQISDLTSLPLAITGDSTLCIEGTYSLGTLPPGVTATWDGGGSVAAISPQNANGSIVKITRIGSGIITVTATMSPAGLCGITLPVGKVIKVGEPGNTTFSGTYTTEGYSVPMEGQISFCLKTYMFPGFYSGVISLNDQVATSYSWSLVSTYHPTNNPVTTGIGPGSATDFNIYVKPQDGRAIYRLTSTNSCGSSTRDFTFIADGPCLTLESRVSEPSDLSIFPNPAEGSFQVALTGNDKASAIKEIIITNKYGKVVERIRFGSLETSQTVNVGKLGADVYIIQVFDGEKWLIAKFMKQ